MTVIPPYSRAALENLVRALRGVNLSDWVDPEDIEYESDKKIAEDAVTHHVLGKVLTSALGGHVGLNADWVNPTWHLGRGRPNRDSGEPYLFEGDNSPEYMILVSTWGEDGETEIEEIASLRDKDALLRWAEKTLASMEKNMRGTRDNPEWAKKLGRAAGAPRRMKQKMAAAAAVQRGKAAQRAAASRATWAGRKAKAREYLTEVKRDLAEGFRSNPRDEHRIYVANLAAYNAGRLKGKWIEPSSDVEELDAQILDAIGGNPDNEWGFHDYDNFPNMGENPDLEDVAAMVELLKKYPYNVVKAAMSFADPSRRGGMDELKEWLDEGYGIYESKKDYVEQIVDDMGGPSALGKDTVNSHFDYESFGHDLSLEADPEDRERYEGMSDEKIGMEYLDYYGEEIPKDLADRYFDFDSYARDVFMEVAHARTPEGLIVFNKR